jgi:two-component system LytT family response regulator
MKTVLIVEDSKIEANQIENLLLSIDENLEPHKTGSAEKALEIAKKINIDVFFIDVQLEDYSGFKLAEQIRAISKYKMVPIVFITGVKDRELIGYREYHCYEYIIKPYSKEEFVESAKNLLCNIKSEDPKILIKYKQLAHIIRVREILYVDINRRKVTIHTVEDDYDVSNKTLKGINMLVPDELIQVHQAFLVNKMKIRKINYKSQVISILNCEKEIPIGRKFIDNIRDIKSDII